jgi:hypothetical protein
VVIEQKPNGGRHQKKYLVIFQTEVEAENPLEAAKLAHKIHRHRMVETKAVVTTRDLPVFVSELIQGVFESIVDPNIQQMEAFGNLLVEVARSVDQFVQDNRPLA